MAAACYKIEGQAFGLPFDGFIRLPARLAGQSAVQWARKDSAGIPERLYLETPSILPTFANVRR